MKICLSIPLALLVTLNTQFSTTHAQGTAFSYQGRLATNAPNGTPLNGTVSIPPFAVLHPNTSFYYDFVAGKWVKSNITASATVTVSGVTNFYTFPGSTDAGWNELQATMATLNGGVFWFQTGRPSQGWQLYIDAGEFDIQQGGLMITNNEYITGAGQASTVFVFNGSTNGFTQLNLTNNPESCALFDIPTSGIHLISGSIVSSMAYQVSLNNLSITTTTNMYCVGLFNNGWNTYLGHVWVGGPAYLASPNWTLGFVTRDWISVAPEVIGFYCGTSANNDQVFEHCGAVNCADGLVITSETIFDINDFTANCIGLWNHASASQYSPLSELCLGFGIGFISVNGNQAANSKVDFYQADACYCAAYVNNRVGAVDFNHVFFQNNLFGIALLTGGLANGVVAPVSLEGVACANSSDGDFLCVTNDVNNNYVIDGHHIINPIAVGTFISLFGSNLDPVWQLSIGQSNAITVSAVNSKTVNIGSGFTLAGNAAGLTNLPAGAITGGFNTNIVVGGHTFYITNGIIMNVQ